MEAFWKSLFWKEAKAGRQLRTMRKKKKKPAFGMEEEEEEGLPDESLGRKSDFEISWRMQ